MMKYFYLTMIVIMNILFTQSIMIKPQLMYSHESDSEQIIGQDKPFDDFELLLVSEYSNNKFYFLSHMGYHLLNGSVDDLSDFSKRQGLQHIENPPGLGRDQRNYYISDMKVNFGDSVLVFYLNKWEKQWGPGNSSLLLSDNIPSFFHFGFKWTIDPSLKFEYFHGSFRSKIRNESLVGYYDESENFKFDINRNIVGHRLDWMVNDKLILSGSELVVYANRMLEMTYLLPFVPFFPLQGYVGEIDNVLLAGEFQYLISKDFKLYGTLLIDEWTPPNTFNDDNHNWFGWQLGGRKGDLLLSNDIFNIEFNWTDHRIYRHKFNINDYYSYGHSAGFWAGSHAQEIYIEYVFDIANSKLALMYSNAKRGELTDVMLEEQYCWPNDCSSDIISTYKRFDGPVESKKIIKLSLHKKITANASVSISFSHVDWDNAGAKFISESSSLIILEENNIIKNSLDYKIIYSF